jgi:hypothetical protein
MNMGPYLSTISFVTESRFRNYLRAGALVRWLSSRQTELQQQGLLVDIYSWGVIYKQK